MVQGEANKPAPLPYEWMTVEEIKQLPIKSHCDDNCEVYLWTTQKYLPDAFAVLKAWGLKYCQTLTWCKKPMGTGQGGPAVYQKELIYHFASKEKALAYYHKKNKS